MDKKGFISFFSLILLTLVLLTSTYILYLGRLQTHIVMNSNKNIQARILTDHMLNKLLYQEDNFERIILPEIIRIVRLKLPPYSFKDTDGDGIPDGNSLTIPSYIDTESIIKKATIRLEGSEGAFRLEPLPANFHEETGMVLRLETEYQGIRNEIIARGEIINKIFEIEESYITEVNLKEDLIEDFYSLMAYMDERILDHDPKTSINKFNLRAQGRIGKNKIEEIAEDGTKTTYSYANPVQINIKGEDSSWEIDSQDGSKIKLLGNIYCQGQLIIRSPLELEGNLILDNARLVVEADTKPIIRGKILAKNSQLDREMLDLKPEKKYIYRAGSYLPGFIRLKINVIKK